MIRRPGDTFTENPGCHLVMSDNASTKKSATMVVDTKVVDENGIPGLIVIEKEYKEIVNDAPQKKGEEGSS